MANDSQRDGHCGKEAEANEKPTRQRRRRRAPSGRAPNDPRNAEAKGTDSNQEEKSDAVKESQSED